MCRLTVPESLYPPEQRHVMRRSLYFLGGFSAFPFFPLGSSTHSSPCHEASTRRRRPAMEDSSRYAPPSPLLPVVRRVINDMRANHPLLMQPGASLLYSFSRNVLERKRKNSKKMKPQVEIAGQSEKHPRFPDAVRRSADSYLLTEAWVLSLVRDKTRDGQGTNLHSTSEEQKSTDISKSSNMEQRPKREAVSVKLGKKSKKDLIWDIPQQGVEQSHNIRNCATTNSKPLQSTLALNTSQDSDSIYKRKVHGHPIGFRCSVRGCGPILKSRKNSRTPTPLAVVPHLCPLPNCGMLLKNARGLSLHMQRMHDPSKALSCDFPGCNYILQSVQSLKTHQISFHGAERHTCDFPGCKSVVQSYYYLKIHKASVHGQKRYFCDFPGCNSASAWKVHLRRHKEMVHGIVQ